MELLKRFYGVFLIFLLNLDKLCNAYGEIISETNQNTIQKTMEKPRTFHDYQTKVVAYKDLTDSKCFLEILTNVESIISRKLANFGNSTERENFKLINTSNQLTKREIWRLAGTRISDFCRGFPTYLIQNSNTTSNPLSTTENELPIVRLRTKREGKYYFRGKFNGHTQSQYLNFDNGGGQHGKAETPKAVVNCVVYPVPATNTVGQVQSQTASIDCSDCFRIQDQYQQYGRQAPGKITRIENQGPQQSGKRYPGYPTDSEQGEGSLENSQKQPEQPTEVYSGSSKYPPSSGIGRSYPGRPQKPNSYQSGKYPTGPTGIVVSRPQVRAPGYFAGESLDYQPGSQRTGSGSVEGDLSGQYYSHRGHAGRFSGTFEGTYEVDETESTQGEAEFFRRPISGTTPSQSLTPNGYRPGESPSDYPGTPAGYPSQYDGSGQWINRKVVSTPGHPNAGTQLTPPGVSRPQGTGTSNVQLVDGKWIPAPSTGTNIGKSPETSGGQWIGGSRVPPSSSDVEPGQWTPGTTGPEGPGTGQWINNKWVPSSRPAAGPGQWIQGPWAPAESVREHSPGVGPGQWVDGKRVPFPPPQNGAGEFINGKWVPTGGAGGEIPHGTGTGQWVDGKWVPIEGSTPIDSKRVSSQITGEDQRKVDGQWVDNRLIPSTVSGTPSGKFGPHEGPTGPPQWTDGKWIPTSGSGAISSDGTGRGPWTEGKYEPGSGGDSTRSSQTGSPGSGAIAPGLPGGTSYGPNYGTTGGSSSSPGSISYRPGLPTSPLGPTPGHISGYPSVGTPDSTTNSGSGYPHSGTSYGTGFPSAGAAYGPGYVPGSGSGDYPGGGISYSPGYPPGSVGYPPGSVGYTPGSVSYSPGNVGYSPGIGGYPPGNIGYPPGSVGYPPGNVGYSPGSGGYPPGNIGYSPGSGGYPPGTVGYPPGSGGYPPGVGGYSGSPGGGYGSIIPPGQYVQGGPPGSGQFINGKWVPNAGTFGNATGQLINGTWVPSKVEADDADSQVLTSVQQTNNETVANAQAHGKFQGGTAQSQVSGTYSGTGSFSASAGSDDGKRGALTQVSGGKDGAQSSAQGRGGVGTSKAQVTLDSQTGDTLSSAQTSGNEQGTQTQVRASEQGGLADAQANGIGPTSSQAKIGFTPHNQVQDADNQTMLFKGGGTAAAQSGTNTGMTQTQIQGKFRYGIKYQGAAQAGSGSTYIRNLTEPKGFFKPINFTVAKVNYNQSQSPQATVKEQFKTTTSKQNPQKSEIVSTTPSTNLNTTTVRDSTRDSRDVVVSPPKNTFEKATVATEYEDQEYVDEEYDDEEPVSREQPAEPIQMRGKTKNLEPPSAVISTDQIVTTEKQHVVILDSLEGLDIPIPRSKGDIPKDGMVLQPGQIIPGSPGFQIPAGFRGKVKAFVSGQNTYAIGKNARSFSPGINQPVFGVITKKISKKDADRTEYMYHPVEYGKLKSASVLPSFVSVTKSEVDVDVSKKTSNVYSAQSTSCGMFTNTCVYANGKKTCFPVRKTNPDGSPVVC